MTPTKYAPSGSTLREILVVLLTWIKGQFLIWLSITVLYFVGFAIARTPLWPVLAILCGVLTVIPHLGTLLGLLLVLAVSYIGSGGNTSVTLSALGVWLIVQLIEGLVIAPRVLGRKLGLSYWIVLLGGIAGAIIAGPIGILIATPVLAVAAVLWRHRPKYTVKY